MDDKLGLQRTVDMLRHANDKIEELLERLPDRYEEEDDDLEDHKRARLDREYSEQPPSVDRLLELLTVLGYDNTVHEFRQWRLAQQPPWVPAIVTSGLLVPGTWICIDADGSYYSAIEPDWHAETGQWLTAQRVFVAETPQITGEHAVWQVQ